MPRLVDHDQRRAELLDATWRVIAAEGIEGATMRRVAEAAGCTTGRVTHYFADKEAVLIAALRLVHAAAGERMTEALRRHRGLDALGLVLEAALPLDESRVLEWRVWLAFWGAALTSETLVVEQQARYREWRRLVRRLLEQARSSGELVESCDVGLLTDQTVALVDGLGIQAVLEPARLPPARLRRLVAAHLEGSSAA